MKVLAALAGNHLVCLISGRDLADLRRKVNIAGVSYAGDHGYRVVGPPGSNIELEVGAEDGQLELAAAELEHRLRSIDGAFVEAKERSLSVHYRMVDKEQQPLVAETVRQVAGSAPGLRLDRRQDGARAASRR